MYNLPPPAPEVEVPNLNPIESTGGDTYSLPSPPKEEAYELKFGDQNYYLYDGDTIVNKLTGERIRFADYNAGELSRIGEFDEYHAGSFTGQAEKDAVNKVIKEENFYRLEDAKGDQYKTNKKGEKLDKYDRPVKDLFNDRGESLSDYLNRERVVDVNAYTTQRQSLLRRLGEFADWTKEKDGETYLTSGDRARELVDSVIKPINPRKVEVIGTLDEVFRGSGEEEDLIKSSLNELNAELLITTDPVRRAELKAEISASKEHLTHSINTQPLALGLSTFPRASKYKGSPGFWGEQVNAAEKSYHMLSNTMGGFIAWSGDALNNEALENWGDDWALETNQDLMEAGYTTDFWSVRNPYDALRFVTTSIVQYAPQLGAIWAASKAGAIAGVPFGPGGAAVGAITGGVGAGFVLAVSSVYQGQPEGEKDPMMAAVISLPIAVADKLGLGKLASSRFLTEEANFLTKEGKEKWIDWAVDQTRRDKGKFVKKWTREEAEEYLKRGIKEVLEESAGFLQDTANAQLFARKTFKDIALQASKSGATEMFTEGLQQVIEEGGLAATTSIDFDMEQTLYNTIEASAVGGVLGASFNLPFSIKEAEKYNEVIWSQLPEDQAKRSDLSRWEQQQTEYHEGKKQTKMSVVKRSLFDFNKGGQKEFKSLEALEENANSSSVIRDFVSALGNPKRFVQAFRGFLSDHYQKKNGKANIFIQQIGDLIGHINILGGTTVTAEFRALDSVWNKFLPSRADLSKNIGIKEKDLYRYLRMDENTLRESGLPEVSVEGILRIKERLAELGAEIQKEIGKRELKLGQAKKYFNLSYKKGESNDDWADKFFQGDIFLSPLNINHKKVNENFRQLISQEEREDTQSTLSPEQVDTIMNEIYSNNLSMESRNLLDQLGVFYKEKYLDYLSQNPYEDMTSFIRSLAKDVVFQSRFGKNGEVLADLLEKSHRAGEISEQQKYDFAAQLSDYLKMNKGTYKPIKNKIWRRIQDNLLFFGTITYMDFNFFANMAEMANGLIGLTPKQMMKYIRTTGVTFAKQVGVDMRRAAALTGAVKDKTKREIDDPAIKRGVIAGTIAPRGTISYLEGVDTSHPAYQKFLNWFWTWNQVESQTNAGRAGRGALAWENISKAIFTVSQEVNGIVTGKSRSARDDLIYWGLDPDRMVALFKKAHMDIPEEAFLSGEIDNENSINLFLNPAEVEEMKEAYQVGLINFTDEFMVRPEPGSTPKWIEDPRFALFTQFKRFISHFTANVIPRVWNGYIKSGKPAMTRQVFTVIMSAYAIAFLSQMIKDTIVYGGTPPWMEDDEEEPDWFRTTYSRAASYTGWGGTPYMAVEAIAEYNRESARKGPFENIFDSILGESPMLNTINTDFRTSRKPIGDKIARRIPFFGDVKQSRESIAELINNIGN